MAGFALYQEGEEPAENAQELLNQAQGIAARLEELIKVINRTNSATEIETGVTLTDALAERDVLKLRHSLLVAVADAASNSGSQSRRQIRSELRYIPAVPVADLRSESDAVAKRLREIDTKIQRMNWEVDLVE